MRLVFFLSFSYCCRLFFCNGMEWKHEKNKAQQEKEQKNEDDQKFIMEIRACFHFLFVLFISITISITNLGHPLHYIIGGKDCD